MKGEPCASIELPSQFVISCVLTQSPTHTEGGGGAVAETDVLVSTTAGSVSGNVVWCGGVVWWCAGC